MTRSDGTSHWDGDGAANAQRRRVRKTFRTTTTPDREVIPRLVEVKGVGRHGSRRYCDDCGHPTGRCICHTPDEAA